MSDRKIAVVTGASSGIGAETARQLAATGYQVVLGARRVDRIEALAREIDGVACVLDVADAASVLAFCEQVPSSINILVNNAGGAIGLEPIAEARDEDWLQMYLTNVLGLMRVTRALLPKLHAGRETYPNGGGYTAAKHAARAVTETLRTELNSTPIRVTDIAPGLVETEFSVVRFFGDTEKAKKPYEGMTPLTASDVAECIVWATQRPWHVNIDELVLKPVAQASATKVARGVGL
jgi:NADP-dependent 3-hydroxy acid dehydrogenase YdfG